MDTPSLSWTTVARLLAAAPHRINEAEVLLDRYDSGDLSADALIDALQALSD